MSRRSEQDGATVQLVSVCGLRSVRCCALPTCNVKSPLRALSHRPVAPCEKGLVYGSDQEPPDTFVCK